MRLVYKDTGIEVAIGDVVKNDRARDPQFDHYLVRSVEKPAHAGSTGRVYVSECMRDGKFPAERRDSYYPTCINAEWIEREDRLTEDEMFNDGLRKSDLTAEEKAALEERLAPKPKVPDNILAVWTRQFSPKSSGWLVLIKGEDQCLWEVRYVGEPDEDPEPPHTYPHEDYKFERFAEYDSHKDVAGAWSPHWW